VGATGSNALFPENKKCVPLAMMTSKWPTRSERAKKIADEAMTLAERARSAGLDVAAHILELAATEARKETEDAIRNDD
jgi:hypothetical protein